ncbi:MAG TPA: hypothetical protein VJ739_02535 [Gemmataceae bacterium]|nr:hypothetical protein [Gemmataceae bacterium]
MASISRDPSGNRSIQFMAPDGKRKTIRLGKVSQHLAGTIKVKVEALAAAAKAALPVDTETAAWLAKVDDGLAGKLAAVGLTAGLTAGRAACPTLAKFLEIYKADRGDMGDGTRTNYGIIGTPEGSAALARLFLAGATAGERAAHKVIRRPAPRPAS